MISVHGRIVNLFIETGSLLGPVLEVTGNNITETKLRLINKACEIVKDEPDFPRCYVKDPFGAVYNLTT
jgi:beta-lactam-binding protein with PASTA domain